MASSTELRVKELLREKGWTTKVLAEKTGMSESYLTHIKNGTRRWNEDSLRKLADAFEISPVELFAQRRPRTDNVESKVVSLPDKSEIDLKVQIVPIVSEIPANPSPERLNFGKPFDVTPDRHVVHNSAGAFVARHTGGLR